MESGSDGYNATPRENPTGQDGIAPQVWLTREDVERVYSDVRIAQPQETPRTSSRTLPSAGHGEAKSLFGDKKKKKKSLYIELVPGNIIPRIDEETERSRFLIILKDGNWGFGHYNFALKTWFYRIDSNDELNGQVDFWGMPEENNEKTIQK